MNLSARFVSTAEKVSPRALTRFETALLPLAKACAQRHPPTSAFTTSFDVRIEEGGHFGPPRGPTTDTAGAIIGCLSPQLSSLEPTLRQVPPGSLVTVGFGVQLEVRFGKANPGGEIPAMLPRP